MHSANLIRLVLRQTEFSQKELASKMGVSAAQVSKWKAGEYISFEMNEKLKTLAGIGDRDPDVVYWTGGIKQADKWMRLIEYLATIAVKCAECSYVCNPLQEIDETLSWAIFSSLQNAGAEIPKEFPKDIDFDYEVDHEENEERFENLHEVNEYSSLIYRLLQSYAQHYDFYAAYISDIARNSTLDEHCDGYFEIESRLIALALAKIGDGSPILSNFNEFKYQILKECREWIELLKGAAFKHQIPLKAELMHLVSEDPEYLTHEAEAEALGFNSTRIHPDIYMDEILQNLRLLHQVLPVICKKLGISEDELKINESELRTRDARRLTADCFRINRSE